MNTSLQPVLPTASRRATSEEIEQGAMALRSVDIAFASLIQSDHTLAVGNDWAVVITDFGNIPEGAQVLLVPPGTYSVPIEVLDQVRYIVGLAWERADYPVLNLHAKPSLVTNLDTLEVTDLCVGACNAGLIGVALDAFQPTVLEVFLGGGRQFSDAFFNVEWKDDVDAYDQGNCTALNGRDWLIAAYGDSLCRRRNALEKGMDAFHEGVMNAIDDVFRPLVRAAEKVDSLLGLK